MIIYVCYCIILWPWYNISRGYYIAEDYLEILNEDRYDYDENVEKLMNYIKVGLISNKLNIHLFDYLYKILNPKISPTR